MTYFRYSDEILAYYPNVVGGVIHARGVRNDATPDALRRDYAAEQAAVQARIGSTPLSQLPSLAAWRAAFRAFGVDPTQYRCAAESLLRRLTKQGDIPSINTLVDIGNLVSIRYGLPVAVFDLAQIAGSITVQFARGDEPFSDLGSSESIHPEVGEVVFTDEAGVVHARRWCWRQSAQSAAREMTSEIVITIESHHERGRLDVEAAQADVLELLKQYAGGAAAYASAIITSPQAS